MYEDELKEVAVLSIKFMHDYMAGTLSEDAVDKTKLQHAAANMTRYQKYIETISGQNHINFMIQQAIAENPEQLRKYIKLTNPQMKPLLLDRPDKKKKLT